MLDKVRPYLQTLFSATAGCTAGAAGGGALVAGGPALALPLIAFAAAALIGKACFDSYGEAERDKAIDEVKQLVEQYGTVERTVEALAAGQAEFHAVSQEQAADVLSLLRASDERIEHLLQQNDGLAIYAANWLSAQVEQHGDRVLAELAGLSGQVEQHADESAAAHARTHDGLAELKTMLNEALANKVAGQEAPVVELPEAERALLDEAMRRGDSLTKAKVALAQRDFAAHRRHLAEAMKPVLTEAFEVLTLQGDGYYYEGRFDDAIGPYEKAHAIRPDDEVARSNLALALLKASRLPRAADIERSIELLDANLARLPGGTPRWARTQNNLGEAWRNLPTGDRAENLAEAIACYELALEVYTRAAHPVDWATTQNNLGIAWRNLPTGDRSENLSKAIACYGRALEVRTRAAHPVDWAMTQNNLGTASWELPTGDRSENLSKAISCYDRALQVFTADAFPHYRALVSRNTDRAENQLGSAADP